METAHKGILLVQYKFRYYEQRSHKRLAEICVDTKETSLSTLISYTVGPTRENISLTCHMFHIDESYVLDRPITANQITAVAGK